MINQKDPTRDEFYKRQISQYAISEDMGVSLLSQMLEFAPTEEEHTFLKSQVQDEIKHNRLFSERADELGSTEKFFNDSLQKLYEFGQQCVSKKDWLLCVSCQSVIEELAIASFSVFFQRADEKTRKMLLEVIDDEKRHLDFAFQQIKKWTKTDEDRKKILDLQHNVLQIFLEALNPRELKKRLPSEEQKFFKKALEKTYTLHKQRFSKLKLEVPKIPAKYLKAFL